MRRRPPIIPFPTSWPQILSVTGIAAEFIKKLQDGVKTYEHNTKWSPLPYGNTGPNCATWVNSLLDYAGVPEKERIEKGEFWGVDWGEEGKIPSFYYNIPM